MTLQDEHTHSNGPANGPANGPDGNWGAVSAMLVVLVVMIVVVAILEADRRQTQVGGEFLLLESRRTMVMAPLPR
ncbi:hypothetical protein [Azospirillum rugosum]|uniref:Uncharacterized protein n=1 Tax=Azospirillum rugosum TaxID=416170 RepID=A0ABS4SQA5_9PROT|nr:hypothetical protein [Azospirillum rugosum]MBP2294736.1 hypothetical protein [Azospirillum rugosum]MDQ0527975.1 hypothetical protein [Azospirillum rugosum]